MSNDRMKHHTLHLSDADAHRLLSALATSEREESRYAWQDVRRLRSWTKLGIADGMPATTAFERAASIAKTRARILKQLHREAQRSAGTSA